jgi:type II secretory pathway pseudopilin PulG
MIFRKNDQRGSVLIELMVAAIIFALVVASVAFYFIYHVGSMDNGRAQLKLQRVGSLLMEEMAKQIREGKKVQVETGDMVVGSVYNDLMVIPHDTSLKPPSCFKWDDINKDILGGPDYDTLNPLEVLDDSHTVGGDTRTHRIMCTALGFTREGDRVTIQFNLKHDLDNGEGDDDLTISFGSTVKLRG